MRLRIASAQDRIPERFWRKGGNSYKESIAKGN